MDQLELGQTYCITDTEYKNSEGTEVFKIIAKVLDTTIRKSIEGTDLVRAAYVTNQALVQKNKDLNFGTNSYTRNRTFKVATEKEKVQLEVCLENDKYIKDMYITHYSLKGIVIGYKLYDRKLTLLDWVIPILHLIPPDSKVLIQKGNVKGRECPFKYLIQNYPYERTIKAR